MIINCIHHLKGRCHRVLYFRIFIDNFITSVVIVSWVTSKMYTSRTRPFTTVFRHRLTVTALPPSTNIPKSPKFPKLLIVVFVAVTASIAIPRQQTTMLNSVIVSTNEVRCVYRLKLKLWRNQTVLAVLNGRRIHAFHHNSYYVTCTKAILGHKSNTPQRHENTTI